MKSNRKIFLIENNLRSVGGRLMNLASTKYGILTEDYTPEGFTFPFAVNILGRHRAPMMLDHTEIE